MDEPDSPASSNPGVVTVAVDTRWDGAHGIGRYSAEVLPRIAADPRLRTWPVTSTTVGPAAAQDPFWLRRQLRRHEPPGTDVFFSSGYNCAVWPRMPQLLVLYDLIHLRVADESSAVKRVYYERLVKPVVRATGYVITCSEFSKQDIVDWCGIDPAGVIVAPGALSSTLAAQDAERADDLGSPATQEPQRQDGRTVLFVGNAKPHKNLRLLLASLPALPPDVRLVCVGVTDADVRAVDASVDPARVTCRQGISDAELAACYEQATCLAFPSTYEGFGLPALEALAHRTPVAYVCDAVAETVGPECGVRAADGTSGAAFAAAIDAAGALGGDAFDTAAAARVAAYSWDRSAALIADTLVDIARASG